jgi:acetyl esterase/lipase
VSVSPDEGVLDPWVADWFEANPGMGQAFADLSPELLELARGPVGFPVTREIAEVTDDEVEGIPVRIYEHEGSPTGLVVYFHGGGFCIGSIGLMDNVARELAHGSGAAVVSVGYRLAPEDPFPAGLDDCEAVTRWALATTDRFGVDPTQVAVAGESAGGNLSAAVALRLRDAGEHALAGQVLMYPGVAGSSGDFPSRDEFDGLVIDRAAREAYWGAYSGDRDLDGDPYAAPLYAESLAGLPPALVVLGGCDVLRDEGRAYAARLREDGVPTEEVCYSGQPHGFLNMMFPAATEAFELVAGWLRARFRDSPAPG